jgi:hypothetical protein
MITCVGLSPAVTASKRGAPPPRTDHSCRSPNSYLSERALRPAVLWRKGNFGSDSETGSRFAERLLTVVATCRQQGRRVLHFMVAAGEAAVQGRPPPSLLPAPQPG